MENRLNILCFAGNDWWAHNPSPEKHWMTYFAQSGNKILYVNSISIGLPYHKFTGAGKRYLRKLLSVLKYIRRPVTNLWVLTPIVLPFWSVAFVVTINKILLYLQIQFFLTCLRMKDYIFWAGLPTPAVLLNIFNPKNVIYYYQDLYTAYYEDLAFSSAIINDGEMFSRADKVICASIGIYNMKRILKNSVYYIPHGVNKAFLDFDIMNEYTLPVDMSQIPKPILGYWGTLEILQDQTIIDYCAKVHPEWSFVFIGNTISDLSIMNNHSNVYFLGYKPINEIPFYAIHFDVCLLNFVQTEWIKYSCPVKLREYLAMGKAIVSVPIIEVEEVFPGVAGIARTAQEFCNQCETEIKDDTVEKRIYRRNLIWNYSWEHTAELVLESMKKN